MMIHQKAPEQKAGCLTFCALRYLVFAPDDLRLRPSEEWPHVRPEVVQQTDTPSEGMHRFQEREGAGPHACLAHTLCPHQGLWEVSFECQGGVGPARVTPPASARGDSPL